MMTRGHDLRLRLTALLIATVMLTAVGRVSAQTDQPSGGVSATPSQAEGVAERVIVHAMGETTVPAHPQRVVVLDTGELDAAMTLGITPVGAVEAIPGEGFPSYLAGTEEITNVGTIEQPNLEAIAALHPDLILSSKLRHEAIYEEFSAIAPTVFAETTGVTWKENFDLFAAALGRTEQADRVKQEYRERIAAFQQAVGDRLAETEVSVVRFLPGDTRLYQKASFIGTVLEDLGLPRSPSQDVDEFAILNASPEIIPEIGGDVIFVTVYGPEDETTKNEFLSHPLWQQLAAVQEGSVFEVSDDLWMLGIGYTAANEVIDDLTRYLAAPEQGVTAGTRLVTHAMGETEVPASPQRVVVLDTGALGNALALGVKPVGAELQFVSYLGDRVKGIQEVVGETGEPNLETILRLQPDLIIGTKVLNEAIYNELSEIASTVLAEAHPSQEWKAYVTFVGEALGKPQQARELLANYDARIAELRRRMGDRLSQTTVSIVRSRPEAVELYLKEDVRRLSRRGSRTSAPAGSGPGTRGVRGELPGSVPRADPSARRRRHLLDAARGGERRDHAGDGAPALVAA